MSFTALSASHHTSTFRTQARRATAWLGYAGALVLLAGCDTPAPGVEPGPSDASVASDQLPPTDVAMLDEWLASRVWDTWNCQDETHPAIGVSPHQFNRVCQNELVTRNADGTGPFPVGATLVKESFNQAGTLVALFVETRVSTATDDSGWYWLRRDAASGAVAANPGSCAGCHAGADRDFVFTILP